jgi:hypothetical protein
MFQAPEDGPVLWRKSTRSAGNGECVEVAITAQRVAVRDSKDPSGPVLRFDGNAWRDFTAALRAEAL